MAGHSRFSRCLTRPTANVAFLVVAAVAQAFAEDLPLNPTVTQATIAETICKLGWTMTIRPSFHGADQIKSAKLRAAGWTDADSSRFQLDRIIPLSLGGSPDDPRNLQLQRWGEAAEKDLLEACLAHLVCTGRLMLGEARRAIWRSWREAQRLCRE